MAAKKVVADEMENDADEDEDDEDEVILFSGRKLDASKERSPTMNAQKKRSSASPIGQERRLSGNATLPLPSPGMQNVWSSFTGGNPLFGELMSIPPSMEVHFSKEWQQSSFS